MNYGTSLKSCMQTCFASRDWKVKVRYAMDGHHHPTLNYPRGDPRDGTTCGDLVWSTLMQARGKRPGSAHRAGGSDSTGVHRRLSPELASVSVRRPWWPVGQTFPALFEGVGWIVLPQYFPTLSRLGADQPITCGNFRRYSRMIKLRGCKYVKS